jgi:hypothetical protein
LHFDFRSMSIPLGSPDGGPGGSFLVLTICAVAAVLTTRGSAIRNARTAGKHPSHARIAQLQTPRAEFSAGAVMTARHARQRRGLRAVVDSGPRLHHRQWTRMGAFPDFQNLAAEPTAFGLCAGRWSLGQNPPIRIISAPPIVEAHANGLELLSERPAETVRMRVGKTV